MVDVLCGLADCAGAEGVLVTSTAGSGVLTVPVPVQRECS